MNKKIKLLSIIILLFSIYTAYADINNIQPKFNPIYEKLDPKLFAEVIAKIEPFTDKDESTGDLVNGYNIIYYVKESTAYNKNNDKIEGEILQHVFNHNKNHKVKTQEVKIKYEIADPIIYHQKQLLEREK